METGKTEVVQSSTLHQAMRKLLANISGEAFGDGELVPFLPSDKFFIGNLLPAAGTFSSSSKFAPTSMGIEFKIQKDEIEHAEVEVNLSCAFYYRVFPSFERERAYARASTSDKVLLDTEFKKVYFKPSAIKLKIKDLVEKSISDGKILLDLRSSITPLINKASADEYLFKIGAYKTQKIAMDVLSDEVSYWKYIADNLKVVCAPKWACGMQVSVFDEQADYRIQLIVSNNSSREKGTIYENSIFESQLKLKISNAHYSPFIINSISDTYKYSRRVSAIGINCSVNENVQDTLITEYAPEFNQFETVPRTESSFEMAKLAENPVPVLESALKELESSISGFTSNYAPTISESNKGRFAADITACSEELSRFESGITLLKTYDKAMAAFKLMNKSFINTRKQYSTWRLFQLVFMVSMIPDILAEEYQIQENKRNVVDLLYYPTGGGKTEALLGVCVFQAFFDRLTDKKTGVSAIIKFPLRMLSLQQLQRVADIFTAAERVRLETNEISGKAFEPFSVGYYVGEGNTPNKLTEDGYSSGGPPVNLLETMSDDEINKFLIVERCPYCFTGQVKVQKDVNAIRLKHICQNKACGKELNVFISDEEIYRYLPTLIVGTLDKIVICGFQKNFRNILGHVKYKCPEHGYTSSSPTPTGKGFCVSKSCNVPPGNFEIITGLHRPEPSLLIQDELHLVRESMGAFDSHYETLINYLVNRLSNGKRNVKILAATATISDYAKQVYELYLKDAVRFPAVIEVYSQIAKDKPPKRQVYGIMPHGRTRLNSILPVLKQLFEEVQDLRLPTGSVLSDKLDEGEKKCILGNLNTVLSYHLKKQDAFEVNRSVRNMINTELEHDNYRDISTQMITGDVNFNKIREITERVENGREIDLLLATSSISHGVDLDQLNIMCFMGMPDNVAEYIQAMSRIGRKYPGIVIVVFDPRKERDQSYYKYFSKFHELYDLLIEGSPLNRWSKRGIEITLPGLFSAAILSYFDLIAPPGQTRLDLCRNWKAAYRTGPVINDKNLKDFINSAVGSDEAPYAWVKSEVDRNTSRIIQKLIDAGADEERKPIYMVMDPGPLRNLRNISANVTIMPFGDSETVISQYSVRAQESGEEV